MPYFLLILNIFIMASGQLLFKQSANFINNNNLSFIMRYLSNPWFYGALFLYGISTLVWTQVLIKMELSVAYPLVSLSYILTIFGASYFFNEKITAFSIAGVLFIMLGVSLITLK